MKEINPMLLFGATLLGLAPFTPPHVIGKIKWVLGGANGMKPMDWFDLLMHGLPLLFVIVVAVMLLLGKWKIAKN